MQVLVHPRRGFPARSRVARTHLVRTLGPITCSTTHTQQREAAALSPTLGRGLCCCALARPFPGCSLLPVVPSPVTAHFGLPVRLRSCPALLSPSKQHHHFVLRHHQRIRPSPLQHRPVAQSRQALSPPGCLDYRALRSPSPRHLSPIPLAHSSSRVTSFEPNKPHNNPALCTLFLLL